MIKMISKTCSKCGEKKTLEEFHKNGFNSKGEQKYRGYCKTCANNLEKQRYLKKKDFLDNQKTKCEKCGEDRVYVLDFHHKDGEEKQFTIGQYKKGSLEIIQNEINKCVCLCANCHREFHFLQRENQISLEEYLK